MVVAVIGATRDQYKMTGVAHTKWLCFLYLFLGANCFYICEILRDLVGTKPRMHRPSPCRLTLVIDNYSLAHHLVLAWRAGADGRPEGRGRHEGKGGS